MRKLLVILAMVLFGGIAWFFQRGGESNSAEADLVVAGLGGFRGIITEVVWFRADRLQDEGRYAEMAQLANILTTLEPHTPEVWAYAAWNLAYNISVMMPTHEDRWRWVEAGLRLLRDEGLERNPASRELLRELAWMFEIKIGADIDSAAAHYRERWREIVEDVRARGAWSELRMDPEEMRRIEAVTGFNDWTDPQLSAIYWGLRGRCADIVSQASMIYMRRHGLPLPTS